MTHEPNRAGLLREIALAHQATPRQVALRFLLRHPQVFVIPKASTVEHVTENAGAACLELSDANCSESKRRSRAAGRGADCR